jgi:putative endopeptidase
VAALVGSHALDGWKEYLRFRLIDRYADLLPRGFAEGALAMRGTTGTTRAARALAATQSAMGEGIGKLYVEHYFPPAQKSRVQQVVANVTAAFLKRVEGATWMSPATKATALQKIKTLYVGIGYPDQWQGYSDLTVDPKDAFGNFRRAEARAYRRALARLGRPVDRTEWWMAPQTAGALLVFQLNSYVFSAALLVPPKFDSTSSDAAAYGTIGAIIGHDVSHYVDLLGADYALDGAARHWWTPEDLTRFTALTQPLVDQFAAYRPLPDLAIDGTRTRTENVADLAGLVAAFDAYRATLGARAQDTSFVRAQDREFFNAFARGWRSKLTDEGLRAQLNSDNHAPDRYRVALVRNLDAWYAAFDVRPGQLLYLPPAARVRVW